MRTFWDQVVALVEQGDAPRERRQGGERRRQSEDRRAAGPPSVGPRDVALKARCEDIERALDQIERLRGLFHGFLAPVGDLASEFDACNARLEETTARLAALEEVHRSLAERCLRLEGENAALRKADPQAARPLAR